MCQQSQTWRRRETLRLYPKNFTQLESDTSGSHAHKWITELYNDELTAPANLSRTVRDSSFWELPVFTYVHAAVKKAYIHTHIHTYIIHTYIHTYIHTHTCLHNTYIHIYIHTHIHTYTF